MKFHKMQVNYRPIGSGAALNELKQGLLTFAASDAPLDDGELNDMPPLIQVPITAGPVCVIYNLQGLSEPLKLSGRTLAGIYAGQIKTWQDGPIARENPYLELNYAKDAGLPVASILNRTGEYIVPSPASAAQAVAAFGDALSKDVRTPIVDPPAAAKGAYPITGRTFVIIPKKQVLPGEQQKFKDFVTYCLTDGQNSAEEMSYTKLPTPVLQQGQMLLAELATDDNKPSN